MKDKITGIVDSPLKQEEDDKLQIKSFELALSEFITRTSMPISLALQGEWGSGKTSLMNRLDKHICQSEDAEFYGIWLNTWHYALINDSRTILFEIISALMNKVLAVSREEHPEKLKNLIKDVYKVGKNLFRGISKVAVKKAISTVSEDAADVVSEAVFSESDENEFNLSDLREKLSALVNALIEKNKECGIPKKAFIFFIDDLDRIEPSLAVKILELLKNIFDIDNCIFILAIDYEVVVKGLKSKFGELTADNEREFRSFFDKIIQLPFQMPVNAYVIDKYIYEMLLAVDFISEDEADEDFMNQLVRFTNLSVGSNPRSIKRLTNTLSFINLLIKSKNSLIEDKYQLGKYQKQVIFALTCLQTAFPAVFNLLADNPHIENWTDAFAKKYSVKTGENTRQADAEYLLDEKWKQILFAFCHSSEYLRRNAFNIIKLVHEIQVIAENNGQTLEQVLPEITELLSVTNLKAETKTKIDINNIRVLYALNKKLQPALRSKLKAPLKQVERKGRMIAKLSYRFDESKKNNWISIFVFVKFNKIYVKTGNAIELFSLKDDNNDSIQNIANRGKTEVFNQLVADFNDLNKKYKAFAFTNIPQKGLFVKKKKQFFEQYFQFVCENVEFLYTQKFIDELSRFIIDFMILSYKVAQTNWKPI